MISVITTFFTLFVCLGAILESQWTTGVLIKPMNHNIDRIDNIINSASMYSGGVLGIYERGLFQRCEYINPSPNANDTAQASFQVQV